MISSLSQYNVNASAVTEENKAVTEAWDNIQEQVRFVCKTSYLICAFNYTLNIT